MGRGLPEHSYECSLEFGIHGIVGPQGEDPTRAERSTHPFQTVRAVQILVAGVQKVGRRMIDVHQEHVGCRALSGAHQLEEVGLSQRHPRVVDQPGGCGDQPATVPVDHGFDQLDHVEPGDPTVGQRGACGETQPQAADDHREVITGCCGQSEPGQLFFDDREQAGHQELVAQFHLVDVHVHHGVASTPQADLTDRRLRPVQFLEPLGHWGLLP